VIVVARRDDVETIDVASEFSRSFRNQFRLGIVDRPGHVAPVVEGVRLAKTEFVAFVDDDAVPAERWLQHLLAPFEDGRVACVGGYAPFPGRAGEPTPSAGQLSFIGRLGVDVAQRSVGAPQEVATVQECNWAWRLTAFNELVIDDFLDSSVAPMYGLDMTLQAVDRGWKVIYTPNAVVNHFPTSGDAANSTERIRAYSSNMTYIVLKHLPRFRSSLFICWAILVGERAAPGIAVASVAAIRGDFATARRLPAALSGRWNAITGKGAKA
jgi:GT2 family glycosyltransferase